MQNAMEAALLLVSLVPLGCCPMAACCLLETLVLRLSLLELGAHCCAARWMALGVANLALAGVLGAVMYAGGQHHVCGSVGPLGLTTMPQCCRGRGRVGSAAQMRFHGEVHHHLALLEHL
jgi:hypothetical protein